MSIFKGVMLDIALVAMDRDFCNHRGFGLGYQVTDNWCSSSPLLGCDTPIIASIVAVLV
jgi:hypothetical protein